MSSPASHLTSSGECPSEPACPTNGTAACAVWTLDPAGRIVGANAETELATGYLAGEVLGEASAQLYLPEDVAAGVPGRDLELAASGRTVAADVWRRRKCGGRFWARTSLTALRDRAGGLQGFVLTLRDLTPGLSPPETSRAEDRYQTLFDRAPIGILYADAESRYIDANASICQMLGYARHELIGMHAADIVAPAEVEQIGRAIQEIHGPAEHRRLWRFRRQDGSFFMGEVVATKFPDGTLLGMVTDVTKALEREQEIDRLSRLYAALSQVNQAIVWSSRRDELFHKVCRALVEQGGFKVAWIGWHDAAGRRIEPVAECGDEGGYLKNLFVSVEDRAEGRGPTGSAFRSGRAYISNDAWNDPNTLPWRAEFERRGLRASAAFPIRLQGTICGTLSVYAGVAGFFHDREVALLEEAAADVSFALDNFVRDEARRQAEETLRNEKDFSDTMIESMPGILYFYDGQRRFLRWNRNFEAVSGYSSEEIGALQPLHFFQGEDRLRVDQRINEVFERGEATVVADFIAKDGTATPYFFTGRRVEYGGQTCLVGVGIDLSDRRRAERRLAESEQKYRELVENANSIILRWNSAGRITFLNEFGQRFFGYSPEEIIGRHVLETIVPSTETSGRDLTQLIAEICAAPESFGQNVNENIRRSGERVWIAWTNRIVRDAQGQVVEILSVGNDVTDRRRAEVALREAELRFHTLFEQTPIGVVVVDPETTAIIECNEQAARQLGYTAEELLWLTIPEIEAQETTEGVRRHIERLLELQSMQLETRHRTKGGEIRDVYVSGRLINLSGKPVVHCVFLDVTERKRAETRIRESEAHLLEAQRIARLGSWSLEIAGSRLTWSDQIYEIFGVTRAKFDGTYAAFLEFVHPQDRDLVQNAQQRAVAGQARLDIEHRIVLPDGTERVVHELADLKRDAEGRPVALAGTVHDITDRARMQAEREKRLQAEEADRIKSAFLATMSHELRTPLNSIIGFTGIMLQGLAGPLNTEQHKQLGMVQSSARHLLALVNDVLDISKIEAGQFQVGCEPFDLRRSIDKVLTLVGPQASAKGLALSVDVAPSLGMACGDVRRFEQIVLNLLSNAIKFTDQGQIALRGELISDYAPAESSRPQPAVRVRVSDTGIGIKPEDLPRLFQPFRQVDSGLARRHEGTGLGLAICRRLAALLGGEISAESHWGRGSVFTLTLPLEGPAP